MDLSPHGKRLKAALKGRSQEWLSRATSISTSTLSGWMTGRLLPTEHNWRIVGKALGQDLLRWSAGLPFAASGGGKSLDRTGPEPKAPRPDTTITKSTPKRRGHLPSLKRLSTTPGVPEEESGRMRNYVTELLQEVPHLTIRECEYLWRYLQTLRKDAPPPPRTDKGERPH